MSTTEARNDAQAAGQAGTIDMKLEVVTIPVSDVDRATEFYNRVGWRQDVTPPGSGIVQFTPHGSACSIQFGTNRTAAAPGSSQNQFLIVSDIEAARDDLVARGIEVGEIWHLGPDGKADGVDPDHASYRSYASFGDPDGNTWLMQELTTRLPGRVDTQETEYASTTDLVAALKRAAAAHGEHEKRIGAADPNWPDWYADYMVKEQSGAPLPE